MSLVRVSEARAAALSATLRESDAPHVERRRRTVGWLLGASAALGVVAAYQVGLLKHLPEPPIPRLDADEVDAAPEAYRWLAMPDAVLGLASYAATMMLVTMGGADRARTHRWLPLLAAAKATADAAQAAQLTVQQWTKHRAFCGWCLTAAGATWATLPLVWPEAREAWEGRGG